MNDAATYLSVALLNTRLNQRKNAPIGPRASFLGRKKHCGECRA